MVCSNPKFGTGHNFSFSEKRPWAIHVYLLILRHHLNELIVSVQKIMKLKLWTNGTRVMAVGVIRSYVS